MKRIKRAISACFVILLAFGIDLSIREIQAAEPAPLRVGIDQLSIFVPFWLGQEAGFFKEEGLEVNALYGFLAQKSLEAIAGKSLDVGSTTPLHVIMARDRGFNYMIIGGNGYANTKTEATRQPAYKDVTGIMVMDKSNMRSARDLEGKKVAVVTRYSLNWLFTVEWMKRNNADQKKVQWVEIPFPQQDPALRAGQVDATVNTEPFVTISTSMGGTRIIEYPFSAIKRDVMVDAWAAEGGWSQTNSRLLEGFMRANRKAMERLSQNPEEGTKVLLANTRTTKDLAANMHWYKFKKYLEKSDLQVIVDLAFTWGLIKKKPRVDDFIHPIAMQ